MLLLFMEMDQVLHQHYLDQLDWYLVLLNLPLELVEVLTKDLNMKEQLVVRQPQQDHLVV